MKYLILLAKLFCTGLLLYFVFRGIDFAQTKSILYSYKGAAVLCFAVIIVLAQTVIAGLRLKSVLGIFNFKVTAMAGIKLWFIGNLFSQLLISFVGGDAMRLLSLSRSGMPYGQSARAIFMDRVLSFVSLQFLYFISLYYLLDLLSNGAVRWSVIALGVFSLAAIIGFFLLGAMPQKLHQIKYIGKILDLAAVSRYLYKAKWETVYVLFLNCLVHICNIFTIYIIAIALGANISLWNSFVIGIPVMYLSMLPFSIGGWGLRENSMIIGFALLGLSSEIALSVSIILGISLLIGSIPGVLIFWQKADDQRSIPIASNDGVITNV
jgi:uncharacterized membrane protein YbhN (UPF0104 family)